METKLERQRRWSREHYARNRDKVRANVKERQTRIQIDNRILVAKIKDAPCVDCGGRFPSCAMDFDHRDPSQKLAGVGMMMGYKIETIQKEIDKCDLVCANCHRIRTHMVP